MLKLARTIADLAGLANNQSAHLAEAIHLRPAEAAELIERGIEVNVSDRVIKVYRDAGVGGYRSKQTFNNMELLGRLIGVKLQSLDLDYF